MFDYEYDYLYEDEGTIEEVTRSSFRHDYFPEEYDFIDIIEEYPRDYSMYDYFDAIY